MKNSIKILLMVFIVALFTGIGGQKVQAEDVTLKNGKWATGTLLETETEQYYKINVKKAGYIKVDYTRDDTESDATFEVYRNSKEEKICTSSGFLGNSRTSYIAVKKGVYYIRINDSAYPWDFNSFDDTVRTENYKIRYTFKAMKEGKKAAKLKKAPSLKKNKTVSGLFYTKKKNQSSFYKITVSKKTKVKFNYEIMATNSISGQLALFNKKGQVLHINDEHEVESAGDYISYWEGKGSDYVILDKGTYYFGFVMLKGESGYYKLKIK